MATPSRHWKNVKHAHFFNKRWTVDTLLQMSCTRCLVASPLKRRRQAKSIPVARNEVHLVKTFVVSCHKYLKPISLELLPGAFYRYRREKVAFTHPLKAASLAPHSSIVSKTFDTGEKVLL
jgi:hypothetical protein